MHCLETLIDLSETRDFELFSDASDVGYGGYINPTVQRSDKSSSQQGGDIVLQKDRVTLSGSWSQRECNKSSTWRELESVHRIINTHSDDLKGSSLVVYSDNKNVSHILEVGSKKENLQLIASDIFQSCSYNKITLIPKWIPRSENQEADLISRQTDRDDWGIRISVYNYLCEKYGQHDIDAFATHYNTKCSVFYSKSWCPGTSGIDAFNFSWTGSNMWLVPPPVFISKTIKKCLSEKVLGTLVVPRWISAPFWPLLQNCSSISDSLVLQRTHIIEKGRYKKGVFCNDPLQFDMVVFRFNH